MSTPLEKSEETLGDQAQQQRVEKNENLDGGEKGQHRSHGGGFVGFWHKELKDVRLEVFKKWAITSMSKFPLLVNVQLSMHYVHY